MAGNGGVYGHSVSSKTGSVDNRAGSLFCSFYFAYDYWQVGTSRHCQRYFWSEQLLFSKSLDKYVIYKVHGIEFGRRHLDLYGPST